MKFLLLLKSLAKTLSGVSGNEVYSAEGKTLTLIPNCVTPVLSQCNSSEVSYTSIDCSNEMGNQALVPSP